VITSESYLADLTIQNSQFPSRTFLSGCRFSFQLIMESHKQGTSRGQKVFHNACMRNLEPLSAYSTSSGCFFKILHNYYL